MKINIPHIILNVLITLVSIWLGINTLFAMVASPSVEIFYDMLKIDLAVFLFAVMANGAFIKAKSKKEIEKQTKKPYTEDKLEKFIRLALLILISVIVIVLFVIISWAYLD